MIYPNTFRTITANISSTKHVEEAKQVMFLKNETQQKDQQKCKSHKGLENKIQENQKVEKRDRDKIFFFPKVTEQVQAFQHPNNRNSRKEQSKCREVNH